MSAGSQQAGPGSPGTLVPVAPSLIVRVVMRPMTALLNPLIGKLAGRTSAWRPRSGTSAAVPGGRT
jgi:hypothetical protein